MTITRYPPNTIWLGGDRTEENTLAASESITPGHLCDRFNNAGVTRVRKHATAGGNTPTLIATEQSMLNKGVDDAYALNDLVELSIAKPGSTWWMLLPSGQTIVFGDGLESNGDGTLRKLASGTRLFTALEAKTTIVTTRIRVEAK